MIENKSLVLSASDAREISLSNSSETGELTADEARLKSIKGSLKNVFDMIRKRADCGERFCEFVANEYPQLLTEEAQAYLESLGYKVEVSNICYWRQDIDEFVMMTPENYLDVEELSIINESISIDGVQYYLTNSKTIRIEW